MERNAERLSSLKRNFLKPNSVFRKTAILIFSVLLVLTLLFGLLLYRTIRQNMIRSVERSNESIVALAVTLSDVQLSSILDRAEQLAWEEDVLQAVVFPGRSDRWHQFEVIRTLRTFTHSVDYVDEVVLLARHDQSVYTAAGRACPLAEFPDAGDFSAEVIGSFPEDDADLLQTDDGTVCISYSFIGGSRGFLGKLLIYLDTDALFSLVTGGDENMHVFSSAGRPVYSHPDAAPPAEDDADRHYQVVSQHSGRTGMEYRLTYLEPVLTLPEVVIFGNLPLLMLLLLPLLFLLSVFVSWVFYRPLHDLLRSLEPPSGAAGDREGDDWSYLNETVSQLKTRTTQFSHIIPAISPHIQRELLIDLIEGAEIPDASIEKTLSGLHDPLPQRGDFVLFLTCDRMSGVLNSAAIENTIQRLKNLSYPDSVSFSFEYQYSILTLVCFSGTGPLLLQRAIDELQHILTVYTQNLVNRTVRHSGLFRSLSEIRRAYSEVTDAHPDTAGSLGLQDLEERIRRTVPGIADESEEAGAIVADRLIDAIQAADLPREEAVSCCRILLETVDELARAYNIEPCGLEEHLASADREELFEAVRRLAHQRLHDIFIKLDNRQHRYLMEAQNYVEAHYMDCDLSLNTVAAQIGISASYLSRIFKAAYNMRFTQKLNDLRIEKSKELLADESRLIRDISKEVGFLTVQNYMRVFKQRVGVTPSEYRMAILCQKDGRKDGQKDSRKDDRH